MTAIADTHRNGGDAKPAPAMLSGAVPKAIAQLLANQESRNSWLYTTGEQARKLNAESKLDKEEIVK